MLWVFLGFYCPGVYCSGSPHCGWNPKPRAQSEAQKNVTQGPVEALGVSSKGAISCSFSVQSSLIFTCPPGHRKEELLVSLCSTEDLRSHDVLR